MSEAKFTPGPWVLDDENSIVANNRVVAIVKLVSHPIMRVIDQEQWNANANLLVAAPDLLHVLQAISDEFIQDLDPCGHDLELPRDLVFKARAAISKALGA